LPFLLPHAFLAADALLEIGAVTVLALHLQALQLRPSLAHLDKEKEAAAAAKKQKGEGEDAEEQKPPELMQLTVQVGGAARRQLRAAGPAAVWHQ
jgi:hypothetical protein